MVSIVASARAPGAIPILMWSRDVLQWPGQLAQSEIVGCTAAASANMSRQCVAFAALETPSEAGRRECTLGRMPVV